MQSTVCKGDTVKIASSLNGEDLRLVLNKLHPQPPNPEIGRTVWLLHVLVKNRILRQIVERMPSQVLRGQLQRGPFFDVLQAFPFV